MNHRFSYVDRRFVHSEARSKRGGYMRTKLKLENLKSRDRLEALRLVGKIILKWVLQSTWIGLAWLSVGTSGVM